MSPQSSQSTSNPYRAILPLLPAAFLKPGEGLCQYYNKSIGLVKETYIDFFLDLLQGIHLRRFCHIRSLPMLVNPPSMLALVRNARYRSRTRLRSQSQSDLLGGPQSYAGSQTNAGGSQS